MTPRKRHSVSRLALLIVQCFTGLIAILEASSVLFTLVRFGSIVWIHLLVFVVAAIVSVTCSRLRQRLQGAPAQKNSLHREDR